MSALAGPSSVRAGLSYLSSYEESPEESDSSESGEDDAYTSSGEGNSEDDDEDDDDDGLTNSIGFNGQDGPRARIETDFDQLIRNIRQSDGADTSNMLDKMWNLDLTSQENQFRDDLREAAGIGRKGKGKGKRGRRVGPKLSHQVKVMIGEGNQAYVDNNLPEATRIMQEVIRIEPCAASAWTVLAQCYADLNEQDKSLQLRVMAAHLLHDAEEWDRLARQSRDLGHNQQALYCYGKVYTLDPEHVDAMWDRASLAKEVGDMRAAKHALLTLLKRIPHDPTILDELRPVLLEMNELALCAQHFQAALDHFQQLLPSGPVADPNVAPTGFDAMQILVLADLYNVLNEPAHALHAVRSGTRWLQGRGAQKFWDACEDDREYDIPHGSMDEAIQRAVSREGELQPGFYALDVNARHRLAIARVKSGDVEEGKMHAAIVLSHDILDYAPLFAEIADAYFAREMYADARPVYEALGSDATTSSMYVLLQTAACRRAIGENQEAADVYEHVITLDPAHNDAKMKLAEIYEIMNEPRKALDLVYQVIESRRRRYAARVNGEGTPGVEERGSLFTGKSGQRRSTVQPGKLTTEQIRALEVQKEKETATRYARSRELWPKVIQDPPVEDQEEVEREWLFETERLVEMFRETRRLFATTKGAFRGMIKTSTRRKKDEDEAEADDMASRLQLDIAYSNSKEAAETRRTAAPFRGISVQDWLVLFMQYAFRLTHRGEYELAHEVFEHLLFSKAYIDQESQDTIRLTIIACATAAGRQPDAIMQARKLMTIYQFSNEPLRLIFTSLAGTIRSSADAFINTALQKHIFRELRIIDTAIKKPEALTWFGLRNRWILSKKGKGKGKKQEPEDDDEDEDEQEADGAAAPAGPTIPLPTKHNPAYMAMYAQMCNVAKSYQSAIYYLLHAYDWCPQDPIICLSLGIASLGRAMQRQADNRHHLIVQAMAFFTQYRDARPKEVEDEVEYNFGRAYHQLGLFNLAVVHYERVLALADGKPPSEWGVAREAAYNLSLIFVINGAAPLAEDLYRKWLTI